MQETICVDRIIDILNTNNYSPDYILEMINHVFHNKIKKSYVNDRINSKIPKYKEKLTYLLNNRGIEQRTEEWYETRKTLITASDFAQAVGQGKFATQKQFYQKKCGYEEETFNAYSPPLKWGCMYEDIACKIYANRTKTKVHEFGLIKHPEIEYIGASPDGITENGIMLEIKCPYKRKITGEVPLQYYYQVQGQLDVCQLDECDYLECEFYEVNDANLFWETYDDFDLEQGIIAEYQENGKPIYDYSEICLNKEDLMKWEDEHKDAILHRFRLKQYNVVRIYKDNEFVNNLLNELKDVWKNVIRYRNDKSAYDRETYSLSKTKKSNNEEETFSFRCS